MKKIIPFYIVLSICFIFLPNALADMPKIQNPDNGHWYQIFDDTMAWHDAKNYCEGIGGYLATIASEQENQFIHDKLVDPFNHTCWVGGTDEDVEGVWQWLSGETWEYANWVPGEPNNLHGEEHYIEIFESSDGNWNDAPNDDPNYIICEWDSITEQEILNYISIMPCRIVDTRKADGAFTPDEIRSYNVWGAVASQGGNPAGCPSTWGEPRAVFLNVIAVPVSGQGNIIAYPFGSAAPTASLVNWRAGEHNIGGTGPVKTCYNCDKDISIKSRFGTTHVVIDVLGYYK